MQLDKTLNTITTVYECMLQCNIKYIDYNGRDYSLMTFNGISLKTFVI